MPGLQAEYHYHHARQRARERWGIRLTWADVGRLVRQIASGRARLLDEWEARPGRARWLVRLDNRSVPVVYDRGERMIVTVLPRRVAEDE